jgi:hypothetical protein
MLLVVLRALPQAPGHDGTRQIIIAFAFLAILAGRGVAQLLAMASRSPWARRMVIVTALAAFAESAGSVIAYHPMPLSYYSPLVGGLPGAARRGFEPTYFWDSMTSRVLDWLAAHTEPGQTLLFRNYTPSWRYMYQWGLLPAEAGPPSPSSRWFILQHRPGIYSPTDVTLLERQTPAFRETLFGVPVLSIYSFEQWQAAQRESAQP